MRTIHLDEDQVALVRRALDAEDSTCRKLLRQLDVDRPNQDGQTINEIGDLSSDIALIVRIEDEITDALKWEWEEE